MNPHRGTLLAITSLGLVAGCNATYAPPIRSTHYGAPGRLAPGQGEVALAAGNRAHGTLGVGLPVGGSVRVEGNVDVSEHWVMGLAGLRATHRLGDSGLVLDGEGGLGIGRGGERCGNNTDLNATCAAGMADGRSALGRLAGGGYAGAGLGWWPVRWFALFGRGRAQVATATNVPATLWWSTLAGPEFQIGPVALYAGAGWAGYVNDVEHEDGLILELGAALRFGGGAGGEPARYGMVR